MESVQQMRLGNRSSRPEPPRRLRSVLGHAVIAFNLGCIGVVGAILIGTPYAGVTPAKIVDRQEKLGLFNGFRRAHAKGVCVEGVFVNNGTLASRSTAAVFRDDETPFVGRFSIGGNNPTAPDLRAGVRSVALDFRLSNGERWRTAMNTNPVLPVRDVESFYDQLAAMTPVPETGKPSANRLAAFYEAHPESVAFRDWQKSYKPTPSFATETYHAINAFLLVDRDGRERAVRWRLVPMEVVRDNTFDDADALQRELARRLTEGPVGFRLEFDFAREGDAVEDPSRPWSDDRERYDAGIVEIRSASPQTGGSCDGINFDPLILPTGMEASGDPILRARSAAYAISQRRRGLEAALDALR
ncbi:catalase family peroxidase [Methylobacterium radiodurans]|uniref:Catalase-related peroxidase n=1 Tax=Methylobacterium radiodurans TaxID=2202828 RepID=A0A2U8VN92_9HYPH|nr:catalase family peroxidase [Methylobacterium radiodurans]AWN35084.1 catalase [Methylobacterium radiodurans]